MTFHSFVVTKQRRRQRKFVAIMNNFSRQSSKKNVKPHCHNKLVTKAENIGAEICRDISQLCCDKHFCKATSTIVVTKQQQSLMTEKDAPMSRHCHDCRDNIPS